MDTILFRVMLTDFFESWRQKHEMDPLPLKIDVRNDYQIDLVITDILISPLGMPIATIHEKQERVVLSSHKDIIKLFDYPWIYEFLFDLLNHIDENVLSGGIIYPVRPPKPEMEGKSRPAKLVSSFIYYDVMNARGFEYTLEDVARDSGYHPDTVRKKHRLWKAEHG
jgi:hypothetical protein